MRLFYRRFWEAVQNLKTLPQRDVQIKVEEIWNEFLGPDASCPINVDSRSFEMTKRNLEKPDRWSFDVAAVGTTTKILCTQKNNLFNGCRASECILNAYSFESI